MTLGGIDETLAVSEIKYYDIKEEFYWTLLASTILVDGEDIGLCDDTNIVLEGLNNFVERGCPLIFDSGTSMVTAPSNTLDTLLPYLDIEDEDCKDFEEKLPTFT